jgi:DNA invertase Pin-like site-specific DNA recombinase
MNLYKKLVYNYSEIFARLRLIQYRLLGYTVDKIMKIFGISRQHFYNVWNIRKKYADKEKEELVLSGDISNMSLIELEEKF